jgi:uncharacterized protein YqjF (DUF2071 family)
MEMEGLIRDQLKMDLSSSLIVLKNGELWGQFSAVSAIFSELGFPWNIILLLRVFPLSILNRVYDFYARHRYQIFGSARESDICSLLPQEKQALFSKAWDRSTAVFPVRSRIFITAQWRNLIIVNYKVPPNLLVEYLPFGTEIEDWRGDTLVSLVGFSFSGTSLRGMTLPFCSDFEEVNLRFYVRRKVEEGGKQFWRRAVVFVKEIVPFSIIAGTANLFYGERYQSLKMDHQKESGQLSYLWSQGDNSCRLWANFEGEPVPLEHDSLAEYITEHYYGYAKRGSEASTEYEVEHPVWRTWPEAQIGVEGNVSEHYPAKLRPYLEHVHSAILAEGSPIRVYQGKKVQ